MAPKITPAIADKSKIQAKTKLAVDHDVSTHDGIPAAYAIIFFDPFKTELHDRYSFRVRIANVGEGIPQEEKDRLEKAIDYIAQGVCAIFAASCGELPGQKKDVQEGDRIEDFCKSAKWEQ